MPSTPPAFSPDRGHPATAEAGPRDPRGRRHGRRRSRRGCARFLRGRDGHDRPPRRRARARGSTRAATGLRSSTSSSPCPASAAPGNRPSSRSWRCRSARSSCTTSVGAASCAVPGVPAGLEELWRRVGRLPWARLVEPAIALARDGRRHAAGARRVPRDARAGHDDAARARGSTRRAAAARGRATAWSSPGSRRARASSPRRAPGRSTTGRSAEALLALMEERGGPRHAGRPRAPTRPCWLEPVEAPYAGVRVQTRGGLSRLAETLAAPAPAPRRLAGRAGARSRCARRARSAAAARRAHDEPRRSSTATATPASSRRASGSARATSCPGSTCT